MKYIKSIGILACLLLNSCAEPVTCERACDGKQCGPDGCGGTCGSCTSIGTQCQNGICQSTTCTPYCINKQCGSDGCGGSCGSCASGLVCQESTGTCTSTCTPDCTNKQCGPDGCGGACGACPSGMQCISGFCSSSCTPQCNGKNCGDDGCGGSCGTCSGQLLCYDGVCETCKPNCTNRTCGNDGCGGTCGTCTGSSACNESTGICMPYRVTGNLMLETQTVYYDAYTYPKLDQKLDVAAARIPLSLRDKDGNELASTTVAADGSFTMPLSRLPVATDWISITPFFYTGKKLKVAALKADFSTPYEPWAWSIKLSNYLNQNDPGNLGTVRITIDQASGALYIFQTIVRSFEELVKYGFVIDMGLLPSMAIVWSPGFSWDCGTCYEMKKTVAGNTTLDSALFVGGSQNDESAWGYPTILHEFGHYVLFQKRDDTVGGTHYMTGTSEPRLAWSEGWATFYALATMSLRNQAPVSQYWRVIENGSFWLDYAHLYDDSQSGSVVVPKPKLDAPRGMYQDLGEAWITYLLWDLWDGQEVNDPTLPADGISFTTAQFYKAISSARYLHPESYQKDSRCPAHAYLEDADALNSCKYEVYLGHFLDAMLCSASESDVAKVNSMLNERQYPYDNAPVCVAQ